MKTLRALATELGIEVKPVGVSKDAVRALIEARRPAA
jgi:hypothetical protein